MTTPSVLTLPRPLLANALKATSCAVSKRRTALMQHVRIDARDGEAVFQTYDYETAVRVVVPAPGVTGSWFVNHHEISRLVAAAAKGEKKSDADQMTASLRLAETDEVMLSVGGFEVPLTVDPDARIADFPDLPPVPPVVATVDRAAFTAAFTNVMASIGDDEMLPVLMHVQVLVADGEVTLFSTNRFLLSTETVPASHTVNGQFQIPGAVAAEAFKFLAGDTIRLVADVEKPDSRSGAVGVVDQSTTFTFTRGDFDFPNCSSLLQWEGSTTVELDVAALAKAATKVTAILKARTAEKDDLVSVNLEVSDTGVSVIPEIPDASAAASGPLIPGRVDGEGLAAAYAVKWLSAALSGYCAEISLGFKMPSRALLVSSPDSTLRRILMPWSGSARR